VLVCAHANTYICNKIKPEASENSWLTKRWE
jgi:hypothetical protein